MQRIAVEQVDIHETFSKSYPAHLRLAAMELEQRFTLAYVVNQKLDFEKQGGEQNCFDRCTVGTASFAFLLLVLNKARLAFLLCRN
eukprot:SAG31_NODE_458_length_15415_cov_3.647428_2_plen_86_part_00